MFEILIEDLDCYSYRLGLKRWTAPFMLFLYPATWPILVYRFGNWIFKKCKFPLVKQVSVYSLFHHEKTYRDFYRYRNWS